MRYSALFTIVTCTILVAGCTRFEEAPPVHEAVNVDDHKGAAAGRTESKPLGPIFGEGYVTK